MRVYENSNEIYTLIRQFETGTLGRQNWTHAAHLTVGCWYLIHHGEALGTVYTRNGIKQYNNATCIDNTATSGYHETITLFWLQIIRHYLLNTTSTSLLNLINQLIINYDNSELPFEYYSQEQLMSKEARLFWVEPDLKPLQFTISLEQVFVAT